MTNTELLIMPKTCNAALNLKKYIPLKKLRVGPEDTKFRDSYVNRRCISTISRPHHFLLFSPTQ